MKKFICFMAFILTLQLGGVWAPVLEVSAADPFAFTVESSYTVQVNNRVQIVPQSATSGVSYTYTVRTGGSYASVDSTGWVTGLSEGSAIITVKGTVGTETYTVDVQVTINKAAAAFSFTVLNNNSTIEVGDTIALIMNPPASSGVTYTFSMQSGEKYASVDRNGIVTGISEGTAYIWVSGNRNGEEHGTYVTVKVNKKTVTTAKKLVISTSTSLDKKVTDANFTFSVSFNITKSSVDYSFEIDDEDIATIDSYSGLVRLRRAGTAVITVSASADGYESTTKDFTLYVSHASSSSSTTTGTSSTTTTTGSSSTGSTLTSAQATSFQFAGKITLNGMDFRTTNNFSAGHAFALMPDKPDGDWWRTPNSFTGSRGVYTAKNEGVATIIYADTSGKQYVLSINSYKMKTDSSFQIPGTIPVGALFGIIPPVSDGRWTRDSSYLSGNGGVYIPLKAGTTQLKYEAGGKTYNLSLKIVGSDEDKEVSSTPPPAGSKVSEVESAIILN